MLFAHCEGPPASGFPPQKLRTHNPGGNKDELLSHSIIGSMLVFEQ